MLASLRRHPLIRQVLSLGLPAEDFALAGSAPLLAHGMRAELGDVDVVARGRAWEAAQTLGRTVRARSGGRMVSMAKGRIEIFDSWFPPELPVDGLIRDSDVIDGIRFVSLRDTLLWKRYLNRDKDKEDIRLLEAYFRDRYADADPDTNPVLAVPCLPADS